MPSNAGSRRVRIIFLSAFALFAAQCWFIKTYGEPYPAIVMPTFVGAGGYSDGEVTFQGYEAVFLAEGREYSFTPAQLLAEFPDSYHRDIAYHALRSLQGSPAKAPRTTRMARLRDQIFPGYGATRGPPIDGENAASLREWLRNRARQLVPDHSVSSVEIRWYQERVRFTGRTHHSDRTPVGSLLIRLDEPAG